MQSISGNHIPTTNTMVSKVRVNREYLMSRKIADELNTYRAFGSFYTFNEIALQGYDANGKEKPASPGTPGVRSIFNKHGAVVTGSTNGDLPEPADIITGTASEWRLSNNVPLMDNRASRSIIRSRYRCTIGDLVEASAEGRLGRATYDYSDFMYCKHLGKIPNNYMVTLRRFPLPVDDYISTLGAADDTRKNKHITSQNCQSIGCLVTWMGTPGNELNSILKYSYSMPFKEEKSEWQDDANGDSNQGLFNGIAAAFDPTYREQYMKGGGGEAFNGMVNKFFGNKFSLGNGPYTEYNIRFRDKNKVYGPVDAVKSTYIRSSDGLEFNHSITLTFEYEMRSFDGINGRQAMLDLLSNILNVTYTTGTFWGGGFKPTGAHQNNIFANMKIFKTGGGFTDFLDAFSEDLTTIGQSIKDTVKNNGGILKTMGSALNTMGGMVVAGALNKFGRPNKVAVNSLLSPAPIGFWHVTIGNPFHPIMSVGNLVLKNTTVEHYGVLGIDDFPNGIKVTCELTRGKPRDIRDIEKLYMHGNDRIYTSMGPAIFDMYKHAKEYKDSDKNAATGTGNANNYVDIDNPNSDTIIKNIGNMSDVLQKYFGHTDTYSIYVSACEQEMGAHKKKKNGKAGGQVGTSSIT